MSFLPTDYKVPNSSGGYMKLEDGENKIRILSAPILGWEDWKDNKPVRFRYDEKPDAPNDPKKPVKHFWAMIVWNYKEEKIQILQITQANIKRVLESFAKDEDWGAPYGYDIKIVKSGEMMLTKYMVNPVPHKPVTAQIKEAFEAKPINLEALFLNQDPFGKWNEYTQGHFDGAKESSPYITEDKANEMMGLFVHCAEDAQEQILKFLRASNIADDFKNCPSEMESRIYKSLYKRYQEANPNDITLGDF